MATRGTGTATMSGMSMDILLGVGFDSDDEEDGGTPLNQLDPASQPLVNANNRVRGRNGNQLNGSGRRARRRRNSFRSIPGNKLNASRILDWLLGRHVHLTPKDVAGDPGHPEWETGFCIDDDFLDIGDVKDICPACTTPYCQAIDSIPFESGLKLTYNDIMSHKWLIGNKYVLHEAIDGHPEDDYVPLVEAARALKTLAPKVPMPKVRAGWKENGKVITISDTVPGDRLYDIWWDLSRKERESIAEQVAEHIDSWRECDLGRISNLVGDAVHHHDNLFGTTEAGFGPFGSDLEFWLAIEQRLRKKGVDEDTIQLLKDRMPPSSPCVFTHGDVSSTNIIVHRGTVTGILGFENAASLPAWAENVAMHFCYCAEDEQWEGAAEQAHPELPGGAGLVVAMDGGGGQQQQQ
ncbi:hypothetical protein NUW58_g10318 [Xylaria curta]|uniref:Uncharacterized protein n=1 Tax=Xylaria curta TaxID=42375 RepID=A0ACC1MMG7_9PEZI|nr:hypothetical protein NUW58_g10318 [Xylaria curta]